MRIRSVQIKVAVFTLVSLLLLALLLNTLNNSVSGPQNTYRALFTDVNGLRVGDDVRIAGVKAGRVDDIEVHGDDALVTFSVSSASPILTTTTLVMRYQNLLGMRYLEADQRGTLGRPIDPHAVIPLSRTSPGFDLTTLLNGFRPLFNVLKPADINQLSNSVVQVLQGQGESVSSLLNQVTQLTNYVANRDQLLTAVTATLTPVLANLARQGPALQTTVTQMAQMVGGLAANRSSLGASFDHLQALLAQVTPMITETRAPLRNDVAAVHGVFGMYVANKVNFEKTLTAVGDILATLARTFEYRSAQTTYTCDIGLLIGNKDISLGGVVRKNSVACR